MGSEGAGEQYSLTEIFAIKFVLGDVIIIAALVLAGPIYAVAIAALLVVTTFLVWYLTRRVARTDAEHARAEREAASAPDPVTRLQQRYAEGELSEAEFERRLERLIDASERAERAGIETEELSLERVE